MEGRTGVEGLVGGHTRARDDTIKTWWTLMQFGETIVA